jgi:hypothetical protein
MQGAEAGALESARGWLPMREPGIVALNENDSY